MLERSEELCPLAGQASLWREAASEQVLHRITVSLFAWRAIRKRRRISRAAARRDSCSSEAKSFAPLRGKPPYGAPKRKQCKRCFCRSGRSRYNFTKTKVLKRKRQKIHISKHRIPICVARHKENVTDRSRMTMRRDSCSSEALPRNAKSFAVKNSGIVSVKNRALPRNAKSFAPLRGKPPYTSIGYADGRSAMKKRHAVKARRL